MTDSELKQYAGQLVEAKLVDGRTLVGALVVGGDAQIVINQPYALKLLQANLDEGPTWIGIPSAAVVKSVRVLENLPEALD